MVHIFLYTGCTRLLPQDVAIDGREQMTNGRATDVDKQAPYRIVYIEIYTYVRICPLHMTLYAHVYICIHNICIWLLWAYINQFSIAYPDISAFVVACPIWCVQIIKCNLLKNLMHKNVKWISEYAYIPTFAVIFYSSSYTQITTIHIHAYMYEWCVS